VELLLSLQGIIDSRVIRRRDLQEYYVGLHVGKRVDYIDRDTKFTSKFLVGVNNTPRYEE
jgi:hypothetical protein